MSDLMWLLREIHANPGSVLILCISSIIMAYVVMHVGKKAMLEVFAPQFTQIAYHFKVIDTKLGIIKNGKPSEQVVTRADLELALDSRLKEFTDQLTANMKELVTRDLCELKHENTIGDIQEIKEMLRERRLRPR